MSRSRNVASVFVMALALGVGSNALLDRDDALASTTTLTLVRGSVLVGHGEDGFTSAHEGDLVAAGETVRTAAGSAAEITYFEGSSVRLGADSQIVVQSLGDVGLARRVDRTWHAVTGLFSGSSRYEVRTPTSTASVRG